MDAQSSVCSHRDVQIFQDFRCCLACGETVFDSTPNLNIVPHHAEIVAYQYAKLNYTLGQEIRLVVLFPGQRAEEIIVDIIHVNLTDRPVYEALSYSWATQGGDASLSQFVYCRGRSIAVTKNCEDALRCLRMKGRKRYLWIDAIAIDQGNNAERNHQVAFMSEIYRCASQVLIYLGAATQRTNFVFDYLNNDDSDLNRIQRDGLRRGLIAFLEWRWFARVWVLQEVALAQLAIIIQGDRTARWTSATIDKVLGLCMKGNLPIPSALQWKPASQSSNSILEVLHRSRNCDATDPRDKVYAVLGLMNEEDRNAITVEYSLTHAQVYINVATYMITERKDLNILRYATCQRKWSVHKDVVPSWVPQWDTWSAFDPLPPDPDLECLQFPYEGPSLWTLASELSDEVRQAFFDNLPTDEAFLSTEAWRDWLCLWLEEAPHSERLSHGYLKKMSFALTQAQISGRKRMVCKRYIKSESASLASWMEAWNAPPSFELPCLRLYAHRIAKVRMRFGKAPMKGYSSLPTELSKALMPVRHTCAVCAKHFVATPICQAKPSVQTAIEDEFRRESARFGADKFCFATRETVGFTQTPCDFGDMVWLLPNASVLFLLRRVKKHYEFLGECHLYRAFRPRLCVCCGVEVEKWKIVSEVIDIW